MERYIKKVFHSVRELSATRQPIPEGTKGLFLSFISIRDRNSKIIEGAFGKVQIFEGDNQPDKEKEAIDAMMTYLGKTDIFRDGNYEIWDYGNNKWTTKESK